MGDSRADVEIVEGDGRLLLEAERAAGEAPGTVASSWVFVARDTGALARLRAVAEAQRERLRLPQGGIRVVDPAPRTPDTTPLWTDDDSDQLGALEAQQ